MLPQEKAPHSACGWADDERAGTWKAQQERGKSAGGAYAAALHLYANDVLTPSHNEINLIAEAS